MEFNNSSFNFMESNFNNTSLPLTPNNNSNNNAIPINNNSNNINNNNNNKESSISSSSNNSNLSNNINQQFTQNGLTVSQIQDIYKRLQQLKFQHGNQASRMPQYIKLYTLLSNDPNFQKIQSHLQQRNQLNQMAQSNQMNLNQINQQSNANINLSNNNNNNNSYNLNNTNESTNNLNSIHINNINQNSNININTNSNLNANAQHQLNDISHQANIGQNQMNELNQQLSNITGMGNISNTNTMNSANGINNNTQQQQQQQRQILLQRQQSQQQNLKDMQNMNLGSSSSPHLGSPNQQPNQPSSIFHPVQAHILKFQIATFKRFIQNQPLTPDLNNLITASYGQFQKQKQQQQQQQQQQNTPQLPVPQLPHQTTQVTDTELQTLYKQAQLQKEQQEKQSQFQPVSQPQIPNKDDINKKNSDIAKPVPPKKERKRAPRRTKKEMAAAAAAAAAAATATTTTPSSEINTTASSVPPTLSSKATKLKNEKQKTIQSVEIRTLPPHPPMTLDKIDSKYPNVKKENIQNPLTRVDTFVIPQLKTNIPYEFFNMPKSKVFTPSVYPTPLDIESANIFKDLHENLLIDYELEQLQQLSKLDESFKYEYESFKLLPYQKSLRGYVLSGMFHQNMLLINHLPNFSAKVRGISVEDASLVNNLYLEQKYIAIEKEKNEAIERQESLLNASNDQKKILIDKKSRYQRLAKHLTSFHQQTEKEEQRRIERNAKQRLQALKANDEEAYVKLLDQTKDTRITHLLRQTNSFLSSLTDAVRDQQKETQEKMAKVGHTDENTINNNDTKNELDEEERQDLDYYHVAHRIHEKVTKQPSILVGGTLKEYQIRGLEWMVSLFNNHLNGILADEMGLGKTIQTISLLTYITETKKLPGPFLVIVPLSTLPNWNNEFDKWAPSLKKITYKGTPAYRKELAQRVKARDFNVLLTTYEYIIKDKYLLSKIKWVHMIIDEGHRMKNSKSKLSYTLNEFYHTDYRLILTGTPLQNNLPELWALLNFVLPKIFNSVKSFDEWFNTPFANTGNQDKIELSEEETLLVIRRLHKVLRPFLLRRLKKDVEKSLPNKIEKVIKCKKSGLQAKMYHQMLKYNKLFVGDKENKAVGIKGMNNKLMQLRKICNHPFVFQAIEDMINPSHQNNDLIWRVSGKFELLDRILPKFEATGHRVLMFFQMTQIMDIMEDFLRFRDIKYMRLDGDTKADDRTVLLKDFNADDSPYFVFLLSTRAGGLGLNLQTADTVIIFDTDWNPHQDLQAQDRAHRIGQKNEVRILRLITSDSIEEYILEKAHQKLDIDGKVIQAGKFDQKSTSEEQEALLRKLIESEERSKENDDELNDDELNEILARNENEIKTFRELDEKREKEWNSNLPRLFSEEELPSIYHQDLEPEEEVPEEIQYHGRTRERKALKYDENISEEQWLRQIDGIISDDENGDEPQALEKKPKGKRGRKKKVKPEDLIENDSVDKNDEIENDGHVSKRPKIEKPKTERKNLKKTNISATPETPEPTTPGASSDIPILSGPPVRRRKNFGTLPISRDIYPSVEPVGQDRSILQIRMVEMLNHIQEYVNPAGRKLCKIFNAKPQRRLYPDYYVIIKHPIAFDMVRRRINNWTYNSLDEYMFDIHLIFKNARIYNLDTSVLYSDSMVLEAQAYKLYIGYLHKELDFTLFDQTFGLLKPNGDKIPDPIVKWNVAKQEAVIIDVTGQNLDADMDNTGEKTEEETEEETGEKIVEKPQEKTEADVKMEGEDNNQENETKEEETNDPGNQMEIDEKEIGEKNDIDT